MENHKVNFNMGQYQSRHLANTSDLVHFEEIYLLFNCNKDY